MPEIRLIVSEYFGDEWLEGLCDGEIMKLYFIMLYGRKD